MIDKVLSVYENVDSARIIVCPCSRFADKGGFYETPLVRIIPVPYADEQLAEAIAEGFQNCNRVLDVNEDEWDKKPLYRAFGVKSLRGQLRHNKLVDVRITDTQIEIFGGVPEGGGYSFFCRRGLYSYLPLDADGITIAATVRELLEKVKPHK